MPDRHLYTIPAGVSFLDTLATAILDGRLPVAEGEPPDRLELGCWTILLPTRRAVRALGEAFMRVSGDEALILPQIRPLGDVEEDALALLPASDALGPGALALELPDAIGTLERQLVLTRLVLAWSKALSVDAADEAYRQPATPAQAASLARELASLMDLLDTELDGEQVTLDKLEDLVPDQFAEHWQQTIAFLKIITETWPAYLAEKDRMAPYARRNALMAEEARRLEASPPAAPVIAAGSTATVPATANLLQVIASLPQGAVVLPGLDMHLDEESWSEISDPVAHPEHPQFGMKQFLQRLGATRDDVAVLDPQPDMRGHVISEVMRPARTTQQWGELKDRFAGSDITGVFDGVSRIDAPSEQDEAEVISLLLRKAAETPDKTAALVTPDRTLARRVSTRLEKWGLQVDDSAGRPLDKSLPGSFMDALVDAAGSGFSPLTTLTLLKHPLTFLGRRPGEMRRVARLLEMAAFRQPALSDGLKAHRKAVERSFARLDRNERVHSSIARLSAHDRAAVFSLLDDLDMALEPLTKLAEAGPKPVRFQDMVEAHIEAGERLVRVRDDAGLSLWRGEAGETLSDFFASLMAAQDTDLTVAFDDYPDLYRSLIAGLPVRQKAPSHPRIHIWGPMEARLQRPDMVVLGGLNEGTWPAPIDTGPWLSRPMREQLGISSPERGIGLSAHDVAQLMGTNEVWLTRAEKTDGAPSVPARWLLRLDAVLEALEMREQIQAAPEWLTWAKARDNAEPVEPLGPPAPAPPVDARPRHLSVTRIEDWIANPYAIFARDILQLHKLEDLAGEPGPALRGMLIHSALQRFAQAHPVSLPNDIAAELVRLARGLFAQFGDSSRIETFWQGQFAVFARWFAATEPERRKGVARILSEVPGEIRLDGVQDFTLSARADRIDLHDDGGLTLYDYKTGSPPRPKQVSDGKAPQLPLEAAIASAGGFAGIEAADVSRLVYISARGYGEGGSEEDVSEKTSPDELAGEAIAQLKDLVLAYDDGSQGYAAMRRGVFANANQYRYDDYAHLARVLEWQAGPGGED